MRRKFSAGVHLLMLAVAMAALAGCTTVPETGRRQFNMFSPEEEARMGFSAFSELKQQVPISQDREAAAMVQRVGQRVAAVAPLPNAEWEFILFESEEPNAFCLPGGKVGVYTGILPITQDEAGLATVIGHEIAHAVARHGGERMSQQVVVSTGGQILSETALQDSKWREPAVMAYGLGAQVGLLLPYSRKHESEADEMGLLYMARAGYDPRKAVDFWKRFAELDSRSGGTVWFLRTHPVSSERARRLQEIMPRALQEYRAAIRK